MALSKAEYKRRLDAALALRGMKRAELPDLLEAHGLKRNAAARAGHDSDEAHPTSALAYALGQILGVGQVWFEEPNWRAIIIGAVMKQAEEPQPERHRPEDLVDPDAESDEDQAVSS